MLKHSKSVTMFFCNNLKEQIFAGPVWGGIFLHGINFRDSLHTHEIHAKISSLRYTYLALPDKTMSKRMITHTFSGPLS